MRWLIGAAAALAAGAVGPNPSVLAQTGNDGSGAPPGPPPSLCLEIDQAWTALQENGETCVALTEFVERHQGVACLPTLDLASRLRGAICAQEALRREETGRLEAELATERQRMDALRRDAEREAERQRLEIEQARREAAALQSQLETERRLRADERARLEAARRRAELEAERRLREVEAARRDADQRRLALEAEAEAQQAASEAATSVEAFIDAVAADLANGGRLGNPAFLEIDLGRIPANPGPQRDIDALQIFSSDRNPALPYDTRIDPASTRRFLDREGLRLEAPAYGYACSLVGVGLDCTTFPEALHTQLDGLIALPFVLAEIPDTGRYLLSLRSGYVGADLIVYAAEIDPQLRVYHRIKIRISGENGVLNPNEMHVLSMTSDADSHYISLGVNGYCLDAPRKTSILIKVSQDYRELRWVSPINTSDANPLFVNGRLFTLNGGSCEPDFLYELDPASGRVAGRNRLPVAGEHLFRAWDLLVVDLYDGYFAYEVR